MLDIGLWCVAMMVSFPLLWAGIKKLHEAAVLFVGHTLTGGKTPGEAHLVTAVIAELIRLAGIAATGLYLMVLSSSLLTLTMGLYISLLLLVCVAGLLSRLIWQLYEKAKGALQETLTAPEPKALKNLADHVHVHSDLQKMNVEYIDVSEGCSVAGHCLKDIALKTKTGAVVAAIERDGENLVNPDSNDVLLPGDGLLLLGRPEQIDAAKKLLEERHKKCLHDLIAK